MNIKTILLVVLGFVFLMLGAIGLILPLLPTTPFVLLSAACFSGTPRLRQWVMRIRFFQEYIENYENRTGLSRKTIVKSLSYLWLMLLISMILTQKLWIMLVLTAIGTAVTIHILCMAKAKSPKKGIEE